jgi:hypothetical protein
VTPYPSGVFGIEPAPGAGVWLMQQGQGQAWPLQSAVQVNPGDHLIFVSPSGPRLVLSIDDAPAAPAPSAPAARATSGLGIAGPRPGLAGAVGNEMVRQGTSRLLARPGPIRDAYYLLNRFRGGSLTSPTMIVTLLFATVGALAGGGMTCSGLLSLLWWKLTYH